MTEFSKPNYLAQARKLSEDDAERVLSRMTGKLPRRLHKDKLSKEEALAIQLEIEDEKLQERRKVVHHLREKEKAREEEQAAEGKKSAAAKKAKALSKVKAAGGKKAGGGKKAADSSKAATGKQAPAAKTTGARATASKAGARIKASATAATKPLTP